MDEQETIDQAARAKALSDTIKARHQQLTDPVGYAKAQFIAESENQLAELQQLALAGLIDASLVQQYDELRAAEFKAQFPEPAVEPMPKVRTFEGLNLVLIGGDSPLPPAIREYAQMVQPERGCTAEDAEHFLAKAAFRDMRSGIYTEDENPQPLVMSRYSVDREADKITLRLHA